MHPKFPKKSQQEGFEPMPLDVLPCSNGEFVPPVPTIEQEKVARIMFEEGERVRRHLGMDRRSFVRSAAALAVGFWALTGRLRSAGAQSVTAGDIEDDVFQLSNLPGERIFDVQTHHVEGFALSDPLPWRDNLSSHGTAGFFNYSASGGKYGPIDPGVAAILSAPPPVGLGLNGTISPEPNTERLSYLTEIFVNSATNGGVLSVFPWDNTDPAHAWEQNHLLPLEEASATCDLMNRLSRTRALVMHMFVAANRWVAGTLTTELERMSEAAESYGCNLGGWKMYTGSNLDSRPSPTNPGYFLDGPAGRAVIEHAIRLRRPLICVHKGLNLFGMIAGWLSCRDIGVVARDYAKANFLIYHSGFNGPAEPVLRAYRGDADALYPGWVKELDPTWSMSNLPPATMNVGTDGLIKTLRDHGRSARHFAPGGRPGVAGAAGDGDPTKHANNPNVYAELGAVWGTVGVRRAATDGNQVQAAHLIGKLIYFLGPRRVVWGTDALWGGSPQAQIVAFRKLARAPGPELEVLQNVYHLPYGLEGDVHNPSHLAKNPKNSIRNAILGRNAMQAYDVGLGNPVRLDPERLIQLANEGLVMHGGTEREVRLYASNEIQGFRTRRELFAALKRGLHV